MNKPGGSETYTYAIAAELVRQGHHVECIACGKPGIVSSKLREIGVVTHFDPIYQEEYDMALMSHSSSIAMLKGVQAFKVQTCHGVYPALEQPVLGMDAYVSITREVSDHLQELRIPSTIIYNGIDCERFYPKKNIKRSLRSVLSLAHSDMANDIIREACRDLGLKFVEQNKYKNPIWKVEDLINEVDLVVGVGRSIYEAMACGRNAVVFDHRAYAIDEALGDGFLTDTNISKYIENNCTGRYSNKAMGVKDLKEEFSKYSSYMGEALRDYALQYLNIEVQVKKYLELKG